ncbi:unnamed protein product [Symbiodinium natans]|uniref:Methyltransferase domain-containing protein n=1 Tax=Symbiodinium natans TaxID=878477 RepID=A0A812Q7L1_9DINO|nr:unnamed protein product [Symbiodinium natans]
MEDFHYKKFRLWAEDFDFCSSSLGLWTGGCGAVCALRAAVVGHMVQLRPGQLVLDVGSGCGHFAEWFHDWFGAQTIGVDFQKAGVDYANKHVATSVPAQFCWMDVASQLSSRWLPPRSVDLAIAISARPPQTDKVAIARTGTPGTRCYPRSIPAGKWWRSNPLLEAHASWRAGSTNWRPWQQTRSATSSTWSLPVLTFRSDCTSLATPWVESSSVASSVQCLVSRRTFFGVSSDMPALLRASSLPAIRSQDQDLQPRFLDDYVAALPNRADRLLTQPALPGPVVHAGPAPGPEAEEADQLTCNGDFLSSGLFAGAKPCLEAAW